MTDLTDLTDFHICHDLAVTSAVADVKNSLQTASICLYFQHTSCWQVQKISKTYCVYKGRLLGEGLSGVQENVDDFMSAHLDRVLLPQHVDGNFTISSHIFVEQTNCKLRVAALGCNHLLLKDYSFRNRILSIAAERRSVGI